MEKTIKILLLEDNPNDAELIHHQISKTAIKFQFRHVSEYNDFSKAIDDYIPDLILSDYNLGGFTGLDALELVKQKCPLVPIIIVTGTINEETAAETIKKGAWDYVVKERLTRLNSAIKNALELKEEKEKSVIDKEKLKISEERYKLAVEGSQDGIWDWNLKTNKIYFSLRWKSMLDYEDHEIKNNFKSWEALLHPEDKEFTLATLNKHLKKETPFYQVEFRLKCKGGGYKWIFARAKALFDHKGNPYRIAGSHTDISERKLMEENLYKALEKATESDRLKSAFLATMSHELRTPLNAIIGFSDIIDDTIPISDIIQYNKTINDSGNHLLSIVEDLFDLTLIETGVVNIKKEDTNLYSLLHEVHQIIKVEQQKIKKHHLDVSIITPPNSKNFVIRIDTSKLKQILFNLLKNALKFTNIGSVKYGFKIDDSEGKKRLLFYVEDTGIGIHEDSLEFIFERFRQVNETDTKTFGGAGIGLSISKKIIELLGGKIWVESIESKGSTFYFTIPLEEVANDFKTIESKIGTKEAKTKLGMKTILIAEDDESSFEYLKAVLEKIAAKIIWAKDGEEAVRLCKENSKIDLVLMDINMPVIKGYEATKTIKAFRPNLCIIAQTAFAISGDREKSLEAGCDDYISKPIKKEELLEKIEKFLS